MADEGLRRRNRKSDEDEPVRYADDATGGLAAGEELPTAAPEGEASIGRMEEHCVVVNTGSMVCILETYRGRDKAIRLLHYALMMAAGLWPDPQYADALASLSVALGNARVVGRLFDDLSVLRCTLAYGWGWQDADWSSRLLTLICNGASQMYYPLEHIAFLADSEAIDVDAQFWWAWSLVAWGLALLASAIRSCMTILWLYVASPAAPTEAEQLKEKDLRHKRMLVEAASAVKDSADFITVVHWYLETGMSWTGGCLPAAAVGALGTLSSTLGIWLMAKGEPISPSDS